jgi:type VI protein secretion system component Hcp
MRRMNGFVGGSVVAVFFVVAASQDAFAQGQSFLFVPGIPGSSVDNQHANWIDVHSVTQHVEGRGTTTRTLCEIRVYKGLDIAGPALWAAAVTGQAFAGDVRVETVRQPSRQRFYEIKLENAKVFSISSFIDSLSGESVVFKAEAVTVTIWQQRPDGTIGAPVSATASCR